MLHDANEVFVCRYVVVWSISVRVFDVADRWLSLAVIVDGIVIYLFIYCYICPAKKPV
jgi:hypothetical protein